MLSGMICSGMVQTNIILSGMGSYGTVSRNWTCYSCNCCVFSGGHVEVKRIVDEIYCMKCAGYPFTPQFQTWAPCCGFMASPLTPTQAPYLGICGSILAMPPQLIEPQLNPAPNPFYKGDSWR